MGAMNMQIRKKAFVLILVFLFGFVFQGCGGGGGGSSTTTPVSPLSCLGKSLPTSASNPVIVSGTTFELTLSGTLRNPSVALAALTAPNATPVSTTTSDALGDYSISIPTAGVPFDGLLHATKPGYIPASYYPPNPFAANAAAPILMLTPTTFSLVTLSFKVTQSSANGWIVMQPLDCTGAPLMNSIISARQAGAEVGTVNTDTDGNVWIFNVPPGVTAITGAADGNVLRAHNVTVKANEEVLTSIAPGPI
jgi:hypothetical protein